MKINVLNKIKSLFNKIAICFCLFFVLSSTNAATQTSNTEASLALNKPIIYTVEQQNIWHKTPSDIIPKNLATIKKLYQQSSTQDGSLRYQSGSYIGKIAVHQLSSQIQWAINLKLLYLDHGSIYFENRQGAIKHIGDIGSLDNSNYWQNIFTFSQQLTLQPNEQGTVWIYLNAQHYAYPVTITFTPLIKGIYDNFISSFVFLITIGGLIALFILSFIAYFKLHREKFVFYYSLHIFLLTAYWLLATGVCDILFTDRDLNCRYLATYLYPLVLAAMMQFTRHFFQFEKYSIVLNNTLKILMYFYLLIIPVVFFMPFQVAFSLFYVLSIIFLIIALFIGGFYIYRGQIRAIYYFIGHLIYALAIAYQLIHYTNIINTIQLPELWVIFAQTMSATLLAIAIAGTLKKIHLSSLQLKQSSRIDVLTQLGNRLALNEAIDKINKLYAIVLLKINKLKLINDSFDHDRGDLIIANSANMMKQSFDNVGQVYRYSGGEFVTIVPAEQAHLTKLAAELSTRIIAIESSLKQELFANTSISFALVHCFEAVNLKKSLQLAKKRLLTDKNRHKVFNLEDE